MGRRHSRLVHQGNRPRTSLRAVRTVMDTHINLNLDDLGGTVTALRAEFTKTNPEWWKRKRLGLWLGGVPKTVESWLPDEGWLRLPRGAMGKIEEILVDRDMEMKPIWDRTITLEPVKFTLKKELHSFQDAASDTLVPEGGLVVGPCGSGKTVLAIGAAVKIGQPTLVIVHTRELLRQWQAMVADFLGIVPGVIQGSKCQIENFTIGMYQTIYNRPDAPWFRDWGCVIVDEVHRVGARVLYGVTNMFAAKRRIGVSATIERKDGKQFLIYETFGDVKYQITKEELVEIGRLVPVRMEVVPTDFYDDEYCAARESGDVPDTINMITRMVDDQDRNRVILKKLKEVLAERGTRVLMLTERVQACWDWVIALSDQGIRAGVLVGGQDHKDIVENTVDGLKAGKIRVGIGTKIADEGLDIPSLTHVFLLCPVHSHPKRMVQMVGRAARKWKRKKEGVAVYFWDRRIWPMRNPDDSVERHVRKVRKFLVGFKRVCEDMKVTE